MLKIEYKIENIYSNLLEFYMLDFALFEFFNILFYI